jgi:F-type H+-transporting ATPase subunit alpha
MAIDAIIKKIEQRIEEINPEVAVSSYGTVTATADGIVQISGLSGAKSMEMLTASSGETLIALNLEADTIGAVTLGATRNIKEGDSVTQTGKVLSISVGDELLGRVVDPLMNPLDGRGAYLWR